jgi:hypothetical protein
MSALISFMLFVFENKNIMYFKCIFITSARLISKMIKIRTYKTIILFRMDVKSGFLKNMNNKCFKKLFRRKFVQKVNSN